MLLIHTSVFFWATLALLLLTAIFYIVSVSLAFYWHEKKTSFVILPMLWTFDFFIVGFFMVALASLLLQYLPEIVNLAAKAYQ